MLATEQRKKKRREAIEQTHAEWREWTNPMTSVLKYASFSWRVFPVHTVDRAGRCSCGKQDCASPGKHPRTPHGCNDATADPEQIRRWWSTWPEANVGVATGPESGLVVLDVDPAHGGTESYHEMIGRIGGLRTTVVAQTGGGGWHVYFAHPGGKVKSGAGTLGRGLDVRADSGYVVAPWSRHASGDRYSWVDDCEPDPGCEGGKVYLPELPATILEMLQRKQTQERTEPAVNSAAIPSGRRNAALTSIAGRMRYAGLTEPEIDAALQRTNEERCSPPLDAAEVSRIAQSIAGYDVGPMPAVALAMTEIGNAERLVSRHGKDIRFCHAKNTWYIWTGQRWTPYDGGEVERRVKETVRSIYAEAGRAGTEQERKALARWAVQSEKKHHLENAMFLARSDERIVVRLESFDADPWLFNCLNGTLDLRTGELRGHRREDMFTKIVPVEWNGGARSELWESFLYTTTGGDPALQEFLQRAVGYTLTGDTREEVLLFIHGPAASGKSTFLEAVKSALGDYARTADFETFLSRSFTGGPRQDIARLAGSRMVCSIEVDEGKKLAEGLVKQLTGGDKVTARFLYQGEFEFHPQFKLWLAANEAPKVSSLDGAMWRRILRVPFDHTVPEADRDPKVKAMLCDVERSGPAILAWAVEGCRRWQEHGLAVPASVKAATREYQQESNPLIDFVADRCSTGPRRQATAREIWDSYRAWAKDTGVRYAVPSKQKFGRLLAAMGFEKKLMDNSAAGKQMQTYMGIESHGG